MIAKKTYENMDFLRGGHPYDTLKIGKAELRILDKLIPIAKELGLEDIGVEDLNKKKAIASWRLPSLRGYRGGRITFFRNTDKPEREYDYGIFIMGKHGTNIEDWRKWDTLEKWKQNIGFMYESVSFERGQDPKSSMGVGRDWIIKNTKWSINLAWDKYTIEYFEEYRGYYIVVALRNTGMYGDEGLYDAVANIPGIMVTGAHSSWNAYKGIKKKIDEHLKAKNIVHKILKESVEFKRGEDPKDAMKIGRIANAVEIEASPYINPSEIISHFKESSRDCGIMFKYYENGKKHVATLTDLREDHPDVIFRGKYYNLRGNSVKESAEFIRGDDPKKAMDIGIRPIEIVYAEAYIGNHSEPSPMGSRSIKAALKNWIPGQMGEWSFWATGHKFYLADQLEGKWVKFQGELYKLGGLDESVDFVRGLDPKRALDIGLPPKMGEGYTVLWRDRRNKWSIERYTNPHTKEPNLVIVSDDYIDYPILYNDGRIAYDNPYRLPKEVRDRAHKLYLKIKGFNESVNFNRGADPKETLELGEYRPEKLMEKILQMGPEIAAKTEMGWMVTHPTEYPKDTKWNFHFLKSLIPMGLKELYRQMKEVPKTNESIDFERGLDPKEKLRIGKDWHKIKLEREFRKVIDFYNEPWLERILPEMVKKLDDLGIEIIYIEPDYRRGPYDYTGKSLVEISWKDSNGKEHTDSADTHKRPDSYGKFRPNEGKNLLAPIVEAIEWYEHNLMK